MNWLIWIPVATVVVFLLLLAFCVLCAILLSGRISEKEQQAEWQTFCEHLTATPDDPLDPSDIRNWVWPDTLPDLPNTHFGLDSASNRMFSPSEEERHGD